MAKRVIKRYKLKESVKAILINIALPIALITLYLLITR